MRRLRALVANLPLDSAFARSLSPETAEWRNTEELLATLIEVVDFGNRMFIRAHSKPSASDPKPLVIPRPYKRAQEPQQRTMTTAEIEAMHPELFVEMS